MSAWALSELGLPPRYPKFSVAHPGAWNGRGEADDVEFGLFAACYDVKKAFITWQKYPPAHDLSDTGFP